MSVSQEESPGFSRGEDVKELWRYRLGDYRLICELREDVLVVLVLRVGHRSRVYRN